MMTQLVSVTNNDYIYHLFELILINTFRCFIGPVSGLKLQVHNYMNETIKSIVRKGLNRLHLDLTKKLQYDR
jgi:hypothetical protein